MPVHHDEDLPAALAILVAGMLAPGLVVAAARELLTLYVSPLQFVAAALAFWLLTWTLIESLEIDRTSFALVGIAWPWPVFVTALFG